MKTFVITICMVMMFGIFNAAEAISIPYDPVPGFDNQVDLTRDDFYKTTFTPESELLITVEISVELHSAGTWENIEDELVWRFYAADTMALIDKGSVNDFLGTGVKEPLGITGGRFAYTLITDSIHYTSDIGTVLFELESNTSAKSEVYDIIRNDVNGNKVPEPATLFLVGTGFMVLVGFGRRQLFNNR